MRADRVFMSGRDIQKKYYYVQALHQQSIIISYIKIYVHLYVHVSVTDYTKVRKCTVHTIIFCAHKMFEYK